MSWRSTRSLTVALSSAESCPPLPRPPDRRPSPVRLHRPPPPPPPRPRSPPQFQQPQLHPPSTSPSSPSLPRPASGSSQGTSSAWTSTPPVPPAIRSRTSRAISASAPPDALQPLLALLLSLGLDLRPLPRPKQLRWAQLPKVIQPFVQVVHAVAGKLAAQLHAVCVGVSLLVALQLPLMHGVEVVDWASLSVHASNPDLLASTLLVDLEEVYKPALALAPKRFVCRQVALRQVTRGGLNSLRNLSHIQLSHMQSTTGSRISKSVGVPPTSVRPGPSSAPASPCGLVGGDVVRTLLRLPGVRPFVDASDALRHGG
ncbi:unnamed protein product [Closterium sp. NIES-54]